MKAWKFFSLNASRVRAIYLLRLESLIILGLVIYLLVAPLISEVNVPAALSAEIVFGLLASIGLWASASGFKQKNHLVEHRLYWQT